MERISQKEWESYPWKIERYKDCYRKEKSVGVQYAILMKNRMGVVRKYTVPSYCRKTGF